METVIQIYFYIFATFVVLGVPLLAHYGLVSVLGWCLTRPSVAVWRQELAAPRWQRAAYVFGYSPMVALPLVDNVLGKWSAALPLIGWIRPLPILGVGLILLIVPALAACWLAAPQYEGERFSEVRAWVAALLFTFFDAIGAMMVNELFSL